MDQPSPKPAATILDWAKQGLEQDSVSDSELLELYRYSRSSAALSEIVRRHSPLVASVIRRLISNAQDAEDAYQATFLALVLSVKKIRKPDSLAAWLYGVAYRSAKRVRSLRRKANQKVSPQSTIGIDLDSTQSPSEEPLAIIAREMQLEVMDQELSRLPSNLREALIEHYLSGNSVPEIALCLNLSVTAVESRLKRGRKALRTRLAMRGVSLTVVAAACLRFQQDVAAATALPWTNRFMELIGNVGVGCPTLAQLAETKPINSQLLKLVQGELVMKPFARSILGAAGGLLVLGAIGTIGFLSAIANQHVGSLQSQSNNGDSNVAMAIQPPINLEQPEVGPFVLAQGGGGIEAGGGIEDGGGTGGGGISGIPANAVLAREVAIKWERPIGPPPSWLASQNVDNERELQLQKSLNNRIDVDFNNMPLSAAIEYISKTLDVPILIDDKALEEESITPEEPITLRLKKAKLVDVLILMLEPLYLTYVIENEVFRITSKKESANVLRFYDMSYLLPDSGLTAELLTALESSVAPDQWQNDGGTASMKTVGSMLLIAAPQYVHFEVEKFLNELSKQSPANLKPRVFLDKPKDKPKAGMGGMM